MEKLLVCQQHTMRLIQRFLINFRKLGKQNITKGVTSSRITLLRTYWEEFCARHNEILETCPAETQQSSEYFTQDKYADIEFSFLEAMGELTDLLESFNKNTVTSSSLLEGGSNLFELSHGPSIAEPILPRINLPNFHGSYTEWISFKDLFTSLIDKNARLTKAQKLHYLRASVSGEAASLLENMHISDANYEPAWEILVSRYDNMRILVHHHLGALFSVPAMTSNTSVDLRNLLNGTQQAIKALGTLGRPVDAWDDLFIYITTKKLILAIREDWEQHISANSVLPKFSALEDFLLNRLRMLDAIKSSKEEAKSQSVINRPRLRYNSLNVRAKNSQPTTAKARCPLCRSNHLLMFCLVFRQYTVEERRNFVAKEHLCFNCLRRGHDRITCPSVNRCQLCKQTHHTMLHISESNTDESPVENIASHVINHHLSQRKVLLATALVRASSSEGYTIYLRALLDQGSEANFISESACQRLKLSRKKMNLSVTGIGAHNAITTRGFVKFELTSSINSKYSLNIEALVLRSLTNMLPTKPVVINKWARLNELELADPVYYQPSNVDLILGADVYSQILLSGIEKDPTNSLLAQKTQLGWIISGSYEEATTPRAATYTSVVTSYCSSLDQLEEQLRKFWEIEEVLNAPTPTPDEIQCEDFFKKTHFRMKNGRYVVRLPIVPGPDSSLELGESRDIAIQRLSQMERRFLHNPVLKEAYCQFMEEYLLLNHMEPVSPAYTNPPTKVCYLPHHGVFKNNDPLGKLRVVFNASQKTTNGCSLNDKLHVGPKLQQDLWSIVTRWRQHRIVFTADMEKMFRQIWLNEQDTDLQRIVWRFSVNEPVKDFKLKTVTYGTAPAPYLAIRTLHQLAEDERHTHPAASEVLIRDSYVDDLLTGSSDISSALGLKSELIGLLGKGGFKLKKWASNCDEVIEDIPLDHRGGSSALQLEDDPSVKTLGILWYPSTDHFGFKVRLSSDPSRVTKRGLLSDIARLFDPLGFLTPSTILVKIMFQQLWLTGLTWDDPLPNNLAQEWIKFREQLPLLESVQIPRWIRSEPSQSPFELHGFADASNKAYAAVIYARVTEVDGSIHVCFVTAKSKVAPLKTTSIPRLELSAAVLLTRLLNNLKSAITYKNPTIFAWTDSSTVLAWLRAHPSRWKTYVANRVSEVQSTLNGSQWRYVPSDSNSAHCASRGLNPSQLPHNSLWWNGPPWLRLNSTFWPSKLSTLSQNTDLEEKGAATALVAITTSQWTLIDQYSSLTKLLRVTAYIRRFIFNCRQKSPPNRITTVLTAKDLQNALEVCIRSVQKEQFSDEVKDLSSRSPLKRTSTLIRLNPFVDDNGLLRVGGRLKNSFLSFNEKFPLILPKQGHFTNLVIQYAHVSTLHGGTQQTLSYLRRKYWILDGRNGVRRIIHRCLTCFRQTATMKEQLMGVLPPSRVRPARPFQHSGVDYAGPISLKLSKGRSWKITKGYISIFVCLCTKAVHIELVGDLTSESFIAAFRRFTSRRGICTDLYSDRATNFVGADAELKTKLILSKNCQAYKIPEALSNDGTTWHFIPPHSPHFGGIWEAAVKSVKHHLRRVIGDCTLTFEEMSTLLSQIEAALNSRPICRLTDDPDDLTPLTPGHFLIGGPISSIPEPSLCHLKENRLSRWQLMEKMFQDFWKRWSVEYLHILQQRYKWTSSKTSVKVNDLVLLKDDRYPPCKWPLGQVVAVHPGSDGLVRVATVRTQDSTLLRPIVKMAVLPLPQDDDPNPRLMACNSEDQPSLTLN